MPVIDFHAPSPSFVKIAFSVWRYPRNSGAALGSCFTIAFRYWSSVVFKHARSQSAAKTGTAANAATARKRMNNLQPYMVLLCPAPLRGGCEGMGTVPLSIGRVLRVRGVGDSGG